MSNVSEWARKYDEEQRLHRVRKWYCCIECDDIRPCVINMSPRWDDHYGGAYEAPDNCLRNADGDYCGSARWKEVSDEEALLAVRLANERCELTRHLTEKTEQK